MGHDTLIEYILMLLSDFKADTSLPSSYQMVVKGFKAGAPSPSEKLTQTLLLRASQVEVSAGQCPCDTFLGQAFPLGLLATLGIMGYQISMVVDLGVCLLWSALPTGRLLRMLLPRVLGAVTHSLLFFHPGQSVRQEGWGRNGLGCSAANDIKWWR